MSYRFIPSEEDKLKIINLYNSGVNCPEIGDMYNVWSHTIVAFLKRNNIRIRTKSERGRKYSCDEHFFDNIDTEAKAYFFGLLFADGCNRKRDVNISLQEGDVKVLYNIKELVQPDKPLYYTDRSKNYVNNKNFYTLNIQSKHMCNILNDYGLTPRKSLTKKFPQIILDSNEDIQRHFIRGYFDGNGYISVNYANNNNKYAQCAVGFSSSKEFCNGLLKIFTYILNDEYTPIIRSEREDNQGIYSISLYKKFYCKMFLNWIYYNANFYIDRKFEKYTQFINTY
jgi:hypothetical protein